MNDAAKLLSIIGRQTCEKIGNRDRWLLGRICVQRMGV
jgi:hypothetical protein